MSKPAVYMDSCCFIDLAQTALSIPTIPNREPHIFYCRKFLDAARADELTVYTSTTTMIECVVMKDSSKPGSPVVEEDGVKLLFKRMLLSTKSGVMPVIPTPLITEAARDLRWDHDVTCRPMDALHIATALRMKCTHFFTTDEGIGRENKQKIALLGLVICTADQAVDLLPNQYRQFVLKPA